MRRIPLAVLALAAVPFLAHCASSGGSSSVLFTSLTPLEPTAGNWSPWLVSSVVALRPPAPPESFSPTTRAEMDDLRARAAARTPAEEANVDYWNGGTARRWNEIQRGLVAARAVNPPRAARGYALVSMAMYDAMVCAWDAKYVYLRARPSALANPPATYGPQPDCPSYVSERAAMSAAAASVLNYLFPADLGAIAAHLADAQEADLDACIQFQSDVDQGVALGQAVATQVLAYAAADHGDDPQPVYVPSGVVGRWQPTPPGLVASPLLPGWSVVKTFLMPDGGALRPGAPPAYGSNEWNLQRDQVLSVNMALSAERQAIALFWADGGGTVTPPGHWNQIAVDKAVGAGFDECRMARMLAALGAAQHDAFVACWECKYFYDVERPITTIRRDVGGQGAWLSFIATPPFPTYLSGHSTTSGAASQMLGFFFPEDATELAVMADEAKDSRLFGGIHFTFDDDVGLSLGRSIGTLAIVRLARDGAP